MSLVRLLLYRRGTTWCGWQARWGYKRVRVRKGRKWVTVTKYRSKSFADIKSGGEEKAFNLAYRWEQQHR